MSWMLSDDDDKGADVHKDILAHLKHYGVVDKDRSSHKATKSNSSKKEHYSKGARLDLHGLTSDVAEQKLRSFISHCSDRGIQKATIIHGWGYHSDPNSGPVLKTMVLNLLERDLSHAIRSYRPAIPREGGSGATIVFFR